MRLSVWISCLIDTSKGEGNIEEEINTVIATIG